MTWISDNFTKLLAQLSFALLAAATAHDWGFFLVVGSKFRSVQTTYDYITAAIEWLPTFLIGSFVFIAFTRWIITSVSGHGFGDRRRAKVISWLRWTVPTVWVGTLVCTSFFWTGTSPIETWIWLATGFSTLSFFSFVVIALVFGPSFLSIGGMGLTALAMVFAIGLNAGFEANRSYGNVYQMQLKGGEVRHVSLLRSFEKGVLARNAIESRTDFFRWDQIERLSLFSPVDKETGLCRIFSFRCQVHPQP